MVERRLVFVGETKNNPATFIESAGLEYAGHLPNNEKPRNKLLFLADVHNVTRQENGKKSRPLWAIDDRPEELLQAAQDMRKDADELARQAIESLSGELILVKLGTDTPSFTLDQQTGIRVFHRSSQQTPYPMHPTPDV